MNLALAGDEAPQAAEGIFQAIQGSVWLVAVTTADLLAGQAANGVDAPDPGNTALAGNNPLLSKSVVVWFALATKRRKSQRASSTLFRKACGW